MEAPANAKSSAACTNLLVLHPTRQQSGHVLVKRKQMKFCCNPLLCSIAAVALQRLPHSENMSDLTMLRLVASQQRAGTQNGGPCGLTNQGEQGALKKAHTHTPHTHTFVWHNFNQGSCPDSLIATKPGHQHVVRTSFE